MPGIDLAAGCSMCSIHNLAMRAIVGFLLHGLNALAASSLLPERR